MADCCTERPNYGTPNCLANIAPIVGVIFQPAYADDGSANATDLSLLGSEELAGFFKASADTRYYPIGNLVEVALPIADSKKEEAANGTMSFLRSGQRSFEGQLWDSLGSFVTKGKLAKKRCGKWNIYLVTAENQLVGVKFTTSGVDYFSGIKIDAQSVDPKFMFSTDATTQKTMLNFNFDINFDDSNLWVIDCNEVFNLTTQVIESVNMIYPPFVIIDCQLVDTAVTTTTTTFTVNDDYRTGTRTSLDDKGNVTGLLVGDFQLFNKTDGLAVTISALLELSTGEYRITYVAQTAGDLMQVTLDQTAGTNPIQYYGVTNYVAV